MGGPSLDEGSRNRRFALALHFHKAGFGGEIGVTGVFKLTAFLDGLGAKDLAEQAVAGFPFAGAFAFGVILVIEGAIGVVGANVVKSNSSAARGSDGQSELRYEHSFIVPLSMSLCPILAYPCHLIT